MGQMEVLEFLKNNRGWHISKDIDKALGISNGGVNRSLFKLYYSNFVERRLKGLRAYEYRWVDGKVL